MTTEQSCAAARLRGVAAGLLTAALAVAAHGIAGSGAPSGTAVVLLAVLAATVGALTATIACTADVRVLLGLLAASQLVGHLMLGVTGHGDGGPTSPAPAMLVAHALAVVIGAILIAAGDGLCRAVSRAVEVAGRAVVPPIPSGPVVVTAGADSTAAFGPPARRVGVTSGSARQLRPLTVRSPDTRKR